jgi:hypothetical protein
LSLSSATTVIVVVVRGHAPAGVIGAVKRWASSSSTRSGGCVRSPLAAAVVSSAIWVERCQADGHAAIVVIKVGSGAHRSRAGRVSGSDKL